MGQLETNYRDLGEMEVFANQYSAQHRGDCFDIPMLAMYCVAMRRKVFEEIGPLDEQFGVGMFEDDDYTLRILRKGYRVICVEDVFIHHVGRASFSRLNEKAYQRIFDENLRYFESKWNIKWKTQSPRQKNRRKDE
jgi:GT2 family glycosyltransferase